MTGPLHLVQAVLEGVTLALADGHAALAADLP
jgi:xylulokinase